ncbi:hypothetical protein J1C56_23835 [Aminobacter anthyllidis]|uniref:Uncharacterized protein n=1 Tax=Aminobacter anthyllidis TaxID=1035067 RepID=A0A9X1AEY1_9HYPH|nr:hypothetical protein [Aminobacter anthyllidis]MBT1158615.1 hypothetical protein [Aminobacter anthyllidis]
MKPILPGSAAVDKFGPVLQDKDRTFAHRTPRRGRSEMAGDGAFAAAQSPEAAGIGLPGAADLFFSRNAYELKSSGILNPLKRDTVLGTAIGVIAALRTWIGICTITRIYTASYRAAAHAGRPALGHRSAGVPLGRTGSVAAVQMTVPA